MDELYTSVAWFKAKDGHTEDFESAFFDSGMKSRCLTVPGCVDITVFRSADDSNQYFMIGHWTSKEAYALWQERAVAEAPAEPFARLVDAVEKNRLGVLLLPASRQD